MEFTNGLLVYAHLGGGGGGGCSYRMDFTALRMRIERIFGMANRVAMLFCLVLFSRRTKRF